MNNRDTNWFRTPSRAERVMSAVLLAANIGFAVMLGWTAFVAVTQ